MRRDGLIGASEGKRAAVSGSTGSRRGRRAPVPHGVLPVDWVDADLAHACERALFTGARSAGAGTRQQLRSAARRFVRRHRRDLGYLRWVLRCAAASSALAVSLLALSTETARAEATIFVQQSGATNPFNGQDLGDGFLPWAGLADLDADGDLDFVGGQGTGAFIYLENTGNATSPIFAARTGAANPLEGLHVVNSGYFIDYDSAPALGDLDGDGDFDLVAGERYGTLLYFENTGSATSPAFTPRTGTANPLDGQDVVDGSRPALVDLDADGDLDLVVGREDGFYGTTIRFLYYENTGSAASAAFSLRTGAANPFNGVDTYNSPAKPSLADIDGDGDIDLLAGGPPVIGNQSPVYFYENTGGATRPAFVRRSVTTSPAADLPTTASLADLYADRVPDLVDTFFYFLGLRTPFVQRTGAANPLGALGQIGRATPAARDLDGDGDPDIIAGQSSGSFRFFENTGNAATPAFVERTGASNPLDGQNTGGYSAPTLGDIDADGDLDLVAGGYPGTFFYYENTGSAASPAFAPRTGTANPLDGFDLGKLSRPALADLDGDGDLDLLAGAYDGSFFYFENTGSAASAAFVFRTGLTDPLDGQDVGYHSAPTLGDVDGDGDLDLVAGANGGLDNGSGLAVGFPYFENTGTPLSPAFVRRGPVLFDHVGYGTTPSLADLDGDGDLDLAAGVRFGTILYYEHVTEPLPSSVELPGGVNPLDGLLAGAGSMPALGDLDADGDLDVVAGESGGSFRAYENTGSATSPSFFVELVGVANPLDGRDAGDDSAPSLGDLDGDGDLDLVSGSYDGGFRYYENTGDLTSPAFAPRTGAANPLVGKDVGDGSAPALADLDADGDLDLVSGERNGLFLYYENTGSATSPAFTQRTGAANPLDGQDVGAWSTPALADVDGDGDLDLVSGEDLGAFFYFENTGSATLPAFALRTGAANPVTGRDVGTRSAPALGDLEADGDVDLVAGENAGRYHTYYLPEPSEELMLGASLAMLALLDRLRRWRR